MPRYRRRFAGHDAVLDDAVLGVLSLGLELRLVSASRCIGAAASDSATGSTAFSEMKLTSMTTTSGRAGKPLAFVIADIGPLPSTRMGEALQRVMQLAVADVDGKHKAGAVPSSTSVKRRWRRRRRGRHGLRSSRILFQRAGQLDAAAGYRGGRLRGNLRVRRDAPMPSKPALPPATTKPGLDRGAGAGAASTAALDQQHVSPLAGKGFAVFFLLAKSTRFYRRRDLPQHAQPRTR